MPEQYLVPKRLLHWFPSLRGAVWRFEAALFGGAFGLLGRLSPARASALAGGLFRVFGPLSGKAEKVRRNLAIAFPELSAGQRRKQVRATFGHLGRAMAELAQAPRLWAEREQRLEVVVEDPRIEPLVPGRAAVLVSAHVGAWQYTTLVGPWYGVRLSSLYAPESNPHMRRLFLKLRAGLGGEWLSRDNSMRSLVRELSAGHCVGLVTDIRVDAGEELTLFGQPAPTNLAPAKLALRFGCPLIAVRGDRLPGCRYRLSLARLIEPDPEIDDAELQARQMSQALNEEFERWIRARPGEWACMKRRWPKALDRRV
jgi:KDO2-lipid IV(A) lauroyltransferase